MKIIRVVLVLPIFFGVVSISSAQFAVGAKAGWNLNSFRGNELKENYEAVPGFNAGAFIKYPVLSFLTARTEVLYMQQGGNIYDYSVMSELTRRRARVAFHNVQIPLMAEFGLPSLKEDNLQPKLLLGGFFSYNIAATENYVNVASVSGYDDLEYRGYSNVQHIYDEIQYGLIAGIAADVKVLHKPVSLEFRYHYNLNQVNQSCTQTLYNMKATHDHWGSKLYLSTLSINVAVTLLYF